MRRIKDKKKKDKGGRGGEGVRSGVFFLDAGCKRQETRDKRANGVAMSDAALQALSDLRGLRGALSEW